MGQPIRDIPRRNRIIYASASLGGNLLSRTSTLWLVFFYAPPADADMPTLVPRLLLGAMLLVIGFEDAIDDLLIGYWSDRTRTRWGRRVPFIVLATPFYVLFFFLVFTPPGADQSTVANAIYIGVIVTIQRIMGTLSGGPMEALLPEIAQTPASRMSIVTWQVFLGSIGAVFALVVTGIIKDAAGFQVMAAAVACAALASRYIGLWGALPYTRRDVEPVSGGVWRSLREAFRNDQFLYFLPTFVLFNTGVNMLLMALPFFADSVIIGDEESLSLSILGFHLDLEEGAVSGLLAAGAILAVIVTLPAVYRLATRWGKARIYSTAMLLGAFAFPLLFIMGLLPGIDALLQSLIIVSFAGIAIVGVFAFPNAIMADIIDYDTLRTGMRREALYYGAQNTVEKSVGSLATAIIALLFLAGETAANPLGIRLVGPVAGLAAAGGWLLFRGYSLPDHVTAETVGQPAGAADSKA